VQEPGTLEKVKQKVADVFEGTKASTNDQIEKSKQKCVTLAATCFSSGIPYKEV
jgi:hypothetical protein